MTLMRLASAPIILIEDNAKNNIFPLLIELSHHNKSNLKLVCYEQPISLWKSIFKGENISFHEECNNHFFNEIITNVKKCSIIIDSVNQMALSLTWKGCLENIVTLTRNHNVTQIILVLHTDCLSHASKLRTHLNHMANAIVTYDETNASKILVNLKKGGKIVRTQEILSYDDKTSTLKSIPLVKEKQEGDAVKSLPNMLSTFKIETEQTNKLEKNKLKLPYMSKQEGESRVYYEPDSVDDWDEEDPDEDLEI